LRLALLRQSGQITASKIDGGLVMNAWRKPVPLLLSVVALILVLSVPQYAQEKSAQQKRVERGKYLVTIAACHDCHSPKADAQMNPDLSRAFMGRPATTMPPTQGEGEIRASLDLTAWSGPWGISYAANLTPDPETGIGKRYTEATFIQAMRTGKKPEGEPLLPPMPWNVYGQMTDDDLKAVFAYLQTVKPIKNFVRTAEPPPAARK
jgi:mono/diheme cytochrome c family protein